MDKPNVLAWSMGARIGQQLAIRHAAVLNKLVLASADPGGTHNDPATAQVETTLNDPTGDKWKKLSLTYPDTDEGRAAAKATIDRLQAAVKDVKAGKVAFKVDKAGIVHASIGRVSFSPQKLAENSQEFLNAVIKAKPSTAKGTYLKSVFMATTMSPAIAVDTKPLVH